MTNFLIVEVESVNSSVPRSHFKEADLEIIADLILESGEILKPLVLKKIGFEKYEVIDGHLEYYAAVRAREKNPNRGEIVNAFIIPTEKEVAALNQVVALKGVESCEKTIAALKEVESPEKPDRGKKIEAIQTQLDNLSIALEKVKELVEGLKPEKREKLNLVTANEKEVKKALEKLGVNSQRRNAAWEAIESWKQERKTLTWENLKKSCGPSKAHKISNFAKGTYDKLKEIADIIPKS
ncbi:hypothetical protein [Nodularia sphaerocarpa]|uniref:ParB N-terminal domain-containing protein n=1 Tax=Nodularia sphaerocarpa TaxID=137816 RepID=UPI001EFA4A86|nr:hypothetical protein [Nodularia sphaerocarpa]MDB9373255.1 hypothetical protein [Nodularia sphaerocarpa CS-585]MDB9378904.1 hypothetical protein [Nodularia sphaerocarpa CS-585A2]ULP73143.1 hypothetical protein BDGGKGIB_02796 [Nodularia sphaerocarpa UHCC 0038]